MRILSTASVLLGLAACAPSTGTAPSAPLAAPFGSAGVTEDPVRSAFVGASGFFSQPRAGQPGATATAIADIEYLAEALPRSPRYQAVPALSLTSLDLARREARSALGVSYTAPPNAVIVGLRDAGAALDAGDRAAAEAALPRNVFTLGPDQTIQRLSQPPRLLNARTAIASLSSIQP